MTGEICEPPAQESSSNSSNHRNSGVVVWRTCPLRFCRRPQCNDHFVNGKSHYDTYWNINTRSDNDSFGSAQQDYLPYHQAYYRDHDCSCPHHDNGSCNAICCTSDQDCH